MAAVFKGHNDIALRLITAGATPHLQDKVIPYFIHIITSGKIISLKWKKGDVGMSLHEKEGEQVDA